MFRKQDFKKVDLLGSGKKNTKIYKAEHIPTGKYYALKEVEAKTLEKLNEYKVSQALLFLIELVNRRKQCSCSRCKTTPMCYSFTATTFTRLCTTHSGLQWCVSIWTQEQIWSISSERGSNKICSGLKRSWRK